ncbi:MAG: hypothetical protein KGI03_01010 [Patescibacteria group bacterium]|nr:hypothetical protein [Patescibacteria group bacterium]
MEQYEVVKDLEVKDESHPLFGNHAAGSVVEAAPESVLHLIEEGFLKVMHALEEEAENLIGAQDGDSTPPAEPAPAAPAAEAPPTTAPETPPVAPAESPAPTVAPAPTPAPAAHPASVDLASKFPAAPEPFASMPNCTGMLYAFCLGIEHHELWLEPGADPKYPTGTRSFHDKNPGNLKYAGQIGSIGEDKDGFCIFPDYNTGFAALIRQVQIAIKGSGMRYKAEIFDPVQKAWRQQNFLDFFKVYDSSYGDDPTAYAEDVAAELSKIAGVTIPITTPMTTLVAA